MLTLLSPAKKLLDFEKPYIGKTTKPIFQDETADLVQIMKSKSRQDIASLMHLSSELADLNYHRYQNFAKEPSVDRAYPAVFLFQGDVYKGLEALDWEQNTIDFAEKHLLILSGLYGLLRPLDLIQPYRLEMGTKLTNALGANLYDYWTKSLSFELNKCLGASNNPILINLASIEYFKVVNLKSIEFPMITIHFKEQTKGQLKVIGIHAKKARGAMAKYLMLNNLDEVESIKDFKGLGYHFCKKKSDKNNLVFIR